jgi:periplasmic protein TonB
MLEVRRRQLPGLAVRQAINNNNRREAEGMTMLAARLPFATGWGLFFALTTFWLLWITINAPMSVGERVIANPIEFTRLIKDSVAVAKTPREKPVFVPPKGIGPAHPIDVPTEPPVVVRQSGPHRIEIVAPPGPVAPTGGSDHDAIPWVRIEPEYPPSAARRGIEGWVLVQFSVTASGQVTDVTVVDADPPGVFDEETIEAVERWRYRPMVEDGSPVERVGLRTVVRFDLP